MATALILTAAIVAVVLATFVTAWTRHRCNEELVFAYQRGRSDEIEFEMIIDTIIDRAENDAEAGYEIGQYLAQQSLAAVGSYPSITINEVEVDEWDGRDRLEAYSATSS